MFTYSPIKRNGYYVVWCVRIFLEQELFFNLIKIQKNRVVFLRFHQRVVVLFFQKIQRYLLKEQGIRSLYVRQQIVFCFNLLILIIINQPLYCGLLLICVNLLVNIWGYLQIRLEFYFLTFLFHHLSITYL